MRRIPRLRQPSAVVLTQCLPTTAAAASPHAAVSRAAAAATSTSNSTTCLASRPRDFSTTPTSRPFHTSRPRAREPPAEDARVHKEAAAAADPLVVKAEVVEQTDAELVRTKVVEEADNNTGLAVQDRAYETSDSAHDDEWAAEEAAEEEEIETDLVIPPRRQDVGVAPRPDDLVEGGVVEYEPAVDARGLEVVGGLSDWFQKDTNMPRAKLESFERFAPQAQVADRSVLEFCVRRAVLEAVLLRASGKKNGRNKDSSNNNDEDKNLLFRAWGGRSDAEAARRVQGVKVEVNREGQPRLAGGQKDLVRAVAADLAAQADEAASSAPEYPSPAEAQELCAAFDESWKQISLESAQLRFAITKRIYQLTGHRVPDARLVGVHDVGELLALVVKPAPARKVYDAIQQAGQLTALPNVEVSRRRRTPIDEAKRVGRWKVIKEILEQRKLPVTGEGGVGKFVEDDWYRGPRVVKKKGRKRT